MTILLLIALTILCLGLIMWGLRETSRVIEYPFLAAVTFLVFIGIPCVPLVSTNVMPTYSVDRFLGMAILCLSMIWLGHVVPLGPGGMKQKFRWYSEDRLFVASFVLTLSGSVFYYKLNRIYYSDASIEGGLPTLLFFFAVLMNYGFALAVLRYGISRQPRYLWVVSMGALFYFVRIVIHARRGTTGEFVFIVLCAAWFTRGWKLPRYAVILMLIAAPVWLFGIGQYRQVMSGRNGPEVRKLSTIRLSESLSSVLEASSSEVTTAAHLMAATAEKQGYEYGFIHWNRLVYNFVPAQLVGRSVKNSLMLRLPDNGRYAYELYGYKAPCGTTVTGLTDCFSSWWYLGCIKFFIIAHALRWMYLQGMRGSLLWQVLYCYILVFAVQAITHQTQMFFSSLLQTVVVIYMVTVVCQKGHFLRTDTAARSQGESNGYCVS